MNVYIISQLFRVQSALCSSISPSAEMTQVYGSADKPLLHNLSLNTKDTQPLQSALYLHKQLPLNVIKILCADALTAIWQTTFPPGPHTHHHLVVCL